jgi:hypothetical protein
LVIDGFLDVSLDVSLDGSLDVLFGLSALSLALGRNTCSTGYTAPVVVAFALTGARHARIEGFGTIPLGGDGDDVALRSRPRSMPRSI